jgi:hypothetical protein
MPVLAPAGAATTANGGAHVREPAARPAPPDRSPLPAPAQIARAADEGFEEF